MQVAAAYGCRCFVAMPDDAAQEKVDLLLALGEHAHDSSVWLIMLACVDRGSGGQSCTHKIPKRTTSPMQRSRQRGKNIDFTSRRY